MLRITRGLHTSCRLLEGAASGAANSATPAQRAKVTPQSLGFTPIGGTRERILPSLGGGVDIRPPNTGPRGPRGPRDPRGPRTPRPPRADSADSAPRTSNPDDAKASFFEGAELAATETRQPRPRFVGQGPNPRFENASRPDNRTRSGSALSARPARAGGACFNCGQQGHQAMFCPEPRKPRGPRGPGGPRGPPNRSARPAPPVRSERPPRPAGGLEGLTTKMKVKSLDVQNRLLAEKLAEMMPPRSGFALFGRHSVINPPVINPPQVRSKKKKTEWWAEGMSARDARKVQVLRAAGDISTQVLPVPVDGTRAQISAWTVAMNKTIPPSKRAVTDEVFKQFL